jgi:prephenate dehydratase
MTVEAREWINASSAELAAPTDLPRVAFQGELGAYGEQAIRQCWRDAATALPCVSFDDVVKAVANGAAEFGVMPVWNTIVGNVTAGCAAVRMGRTTPNSLAVIGDTHVVVRHQLLGLPGASLDEISSVASHPVALAQCSRFFASHRHMTPRPAYDTAGAAHEVALNGVWSVAAIAGSIAATRYGLCVLKEDIQDVPDNVTQFLVLGRVAIPSRRQTGAGRTGASRW